MANNMTIKIGVPSPNNLTVEPGLAIKLAQFGALAIIQFHLGIVLEHQNSLEPLASEAEL